MLGRGFIGNAQPSMARLYRRCLQARPARRLIAFATRLIPACVWHSQADLPAAMDTSLPLTLTIHSCCMRASAILSAYASRTLALRIYRCERDQHDLAAPARPKQPGDLPINVNFPTRSMPMICAARRRLSVAMQSTACVSTRSLNR